MRFVNHRAVRYRNAMNITIDARPLLEKIPGGVSLYTRHLIEALCQRAPEHSWRLFINAARGNPNLPAAVPVTRKKIPNKLFNLALKCTKHPRLDRYTNGRVWISPNLNFTALSPSCIFIQVVHDLSFLVNPSWYTPKSRVWHRAIGPEKLITRAQALVAISRTTAADTARHFPEAASKIHCIYPGPTARPIAETAARSVCDAYALPQRFFLCIGSLEARKNLPLLLDAWRMFCHTAHAPHALVICGALQGIKGERIRNCGIVSEQEKNALLSRCEALIFPTLYEGFGLPALEALSHGKPVLAGHESSVGEVVGDAGLLVSPYKPHELTHAMRLIAENPDIQKSLSQNARLQAKKFSWETAAESFLRIINSLTN